MSVSVKSKAITRTVAVIIAVIVIVVAVGGAYAAISTIKPSSSSTTTTSSTSTITSSTATTSSTTSTSSTTTTSSTTSTTTSSSSGKTGGTLTVGALVQQSSLDPLQGLTGPFAGTGFNAIFEQLIYYGPSGTFTPGLALNWTEVNATTYNFNLRQGVLFQDGTQFNASAVVDDMTRSIDNTSATRSLSFLVSNVTALSQYSVQFNLLSSGPYGDFLTYMASLYGSMVSPSAVLKYGASGFGLHPVGTGPYSFVEWVNNDHLTLQANPNYWGPKPYIQTIIVKIIPDPTTLTLALEAGQVQLAELPAQQASELTSINSTTLTVHAGADYDMYMMDVNENNKSNPALQNVLVRQALNYAINRTALIQAVQLGYGSPATGSLIPILNAPYYNASIAGYPAGGNITEAKALLKQAGYTGLDLSIEVSGTFANGLSIATVLQQEFAQANITLTIQNDAFSVFIGHLFQTRDFQLDVHDNAGASPYAQFQSLLYGGPGGRDLSNINDSKLNALIVQLGQTSNVTEKEQISNQITQVEISQAYNIYLYYVPRVVAWSNTVQGFGIPNPNYWGSIISSGPLGLNAYLSSA
jgi:peptide/nickel transport system substrate-binding protein